MADSLHFFFYDLTKITLLLTGVIFLVTILRSFMSVERTRALLGGKREGAGNVAAAGLGVITPFCSCSAVPAFIGFVAAGVLRPPTRASLAGLFPSAGWLRAIFASCTNELRCRQVVRGSVMT
jgi:uncharacterized membrane protein YraQ (UPF0718 family)